MGPTDFDRLAVIRLFFPFVWLSLAHLVIYIYDTYTSTTPYCLSFYAYHLSAQQILSWDLSVSLLLSFHIGIIEIAETLLVLFERDWVELYFQTKRDWLRKLKRIGSMLKLKKKKEMSVSCGSFFPTLFCFTKSVLPDSVHNAAIHCKSKNFHPYFISLTLPDANFF